MVTLLCVQDSPEARPSMSVVVKMFDGGVEVVSPPKVFHYFFSSWNKMRVPLETSEGSSGSLN